MIKFVQELYLGSGGGIATVGWDCYVKGICMCMFRGEIRAHTQTLNTVNK